MITLRLVLAVLALLGLAALAFAGSRIEKSEDDDGDMQKYSF